MNAWVFCCLPNTKTAKVEFEGFSEDSEFSSNTRVRHPCTICPAVEIIAALTVLPYASHMGIIFLVRAVFVVRAWIDVSAEAIVTKIMF